MNTLNSATKRIGILGAGFVGITLAARLLKIPTTEIVLFEESQEKLEAFSDRRYLVLEPGLDSILDKALEEQRLKFNDNASLLDAVFICIGTPRIDSRNERFQKLADAAEFSSSVLVEYGHIFLRSTVELGTTERLHQLFVESNKKKISFFFAPERTAEGCAIEELDSLPQILGAADSKNLSKGAFFLNALGFSVLEAADSKSAELSKLACNTWRDTTFAFANELARISELSGVNAREVIHLANFNYPRSNIPLPGPVGGPCLSKDAYILLDGLGEQFPKNESLILTARKINEGLIERIAIKILALGKKESKLTVLIVGAAFKAFPRTNDIREGVADQLLKHNEFDNNNVAFWLWDEDLSLDDMLEYRDIWINRRPDFDVDVIVIGNNANWIASDKNKEYFKSLSVSTTVIDPWGLTEHWDTGLAKHQILGNGTMTNGH